MISFSCLHCGATIKAKDSSAGLKGKCKKCGKVVVVPTSVVEDTVSAIDEWESSDWGGGSDEQDPYANMPNPSRAGNTRGSKIHTSKVFRRLMTFAFVFACAAGLVVSLGVAFVLIGKWSSGFDDGDAFRDLDRSAAELNTALELGIDREDYGRLLRQMALEIDLASKRVKSPEGHDLDHSEVPRMVEAVQRYGIEWKLGKLRSRWEWMAFTFRDQEQMQLTPLEVRQMLDASEDIVQQAYSRMTLDSGHKWQRHTEAELDFIWQHCQLNQGDSILDVGCGSGRHTISAAKRGLRAMGVDFCPSLVERAREAAKDANATFHVLDFRHQSLDTEFDCVMCLYDVIGSAVGRKSELQLLRNIKKHLRPGGYAVISVMNLALTKKNATQLFSLETEHNRLLELPPSNTMESSGDIFNPDYYMLDAAEGVVYRKEQFSAGRDLPAELIVRDRRYTKSTITAVAKAVEFEVLLCHCVHAGGWEKDLAEDDDAAKEILLVCRKPIDPTEH